MADSPQEPSYPRSDFDPVPRPFRLDDLDAAGANVSRPAKPFDPAELPDKWDIAADKPAGIERAPQAFTQPTSQPLPASGGLSLEDLGADVPFPAPSEDLDTPILHEPSSTSRAIRELIESVAIACVLAFVFKTFEAEAFVIPTGSMATTLMGRHKDVECPQCGYRFSASASEEVDQETGSPVVVDGQIDRGKDVISCTCPICRWPTSTDPESANAVARRANRSYTGDRIWVSKVPFHLMEPRRWEVIVFRYPLGAEKYYIKRLIGLPNETVQIRHGDILTRAKDELEWVMQRKPADKVLAMAQTVHDNDYVPANLTSLGWPARWQPNAPIDMPGNWHPLDEGRRQELDGTAQGDMWMRYQHLILTADDWHNVVEGDWDQVSRPKPHLITDFYAFNSREIRDNSKPSIAHGLHWVGDLVLECDVDVRGTAGSVLLDLVKAGRHYGANIDVGAGQATLSISDQPHWQRTAPVALSPGRHRLRLANVDAQLLLWVDGQVIEFNEPTTYDSPDDDGPQASAIDAGDLAPAGIGSRGLAMEVSHLRILRDVYYIATSSDYSISDFSSGQYASRQVAESPGFWSDPTKWQGALGHSVFDDRQSVEFTMDEDQFFVLGDNSPYSSDARLWPTQHHVDRKLLIGKALFIYWPHPWDMDLPGTDVELPIVPNFKGMGFIR